MDSIRFYGAKIFIKQLIYKTKINLKYALLRVNRGSLRWHTKNSYTTVTVDGNEIISYTFFKWKFSYWHFSYGWCNVFHILVKRRCCLNVVRYFANIVLISTRAIWNLSNFTPCD